MKKIIAGFAIALGTTLAATSGAFAADDPQGVWIMKNKKVTVKVVYCGGKKLCANIVGLAEPTSKIDGKPKVDRENPKESLRGRPLMGLAIMSGMTPTGENTWKGKIYNADDGGTYRSNVKLSGNAMTVQGCWGPFCKDMKFVRAN